MHKKLLTLMFEFVQLKPIGTYKNLALNKILFCIFLKLWE